MTHWFEQWRHEITNKSSYGYDNFVLWILIVPISNYCFLRIKGWKKKITLEVEVSVFYLAKDVVLLPTQGYAQYDIWIEKFEQVWFIFTLSPVVKDDRLFDIFGETGRKNDLKP